MVRQFVIFLLKLYRKYISPLKGRPTCIYTPTCSLYAIQALEKYGIFKGTYLAIRRVLRCHPYAKGGYDPVP
jgi:putative membrane protein insertion efficiency factor